LKCWNSPLPSQDTLRILVDFTINVTNFIYQGKTYIDPLRHFELLPFPLVLFMSIISSISFLSKEKHKRSTQVYNIQLQQKARRQTIHCSEEFLPKPTHLSAVDTQ